MAYNAASWSSPRTGLYRLRSCKPSSRSYPSTRDRHTVKNGETGERFVALSEEDICEVLETIGSSTNAQQSLTNTAANHS